jgi:hypothetical protein
VQEHPRYPHKFSHVLATHIDTLLQDTGREERRHPVDVLVVDCDLQGQIMGEGSI